jgi:NAD(P)-dependent dehydrogenase (short-subunit alcohol dehydrogenase family)
MNDSKSPQVVVVTGVNGGLGQALARAFIDAGYRVAGIGRQSGAADSLRNLPSDRFAYAQADLADAGQVAAAFESIERRFGSVDILFNNAAVYPRVGFLEEGASDWAAAIAANVNGVAFCCKAALPIMRRKGRGRIYSVGSFADVAPIPRSAAYAASKGALHALVKGIAADLQGVAGDLQVHEWIPGHMKTRMSEFTGTEPSVSAAWAVAIVQADNASKNGTIFENDREWFPPVGLKQRILRRLGVKR